MTIINTNSDATYFQYTRLVRKVADAQLFTIDGQDVWFPKSTIQAIDTKNCIVGVSTWMAKSKKLL